MHRLIVSAALLVVLLGCSRKPAATEHYRPLAPEPFPLAPLFLRDVSRDTYAPAAAPSLWPPDVRAAVAQLLNQPSLSLAAPGDSANLYCLRQPGLPDYRLVAAAIGRRFAVLEIEAGGFAPQSTLWVLSRGPQGTTPLWSQPGSWALTSDTIAGAISSGALWSQAKPLSAPPAGT